MNASICALFAKTKRLLTQDAGQDLIEYALVVAMIAFAAVGGMNSVATAINNAFITIGTTLTSNI